MVMTGPWLLYGANGYTGELVARLAAAKGHRPILAGRRAGEVCALAEELRLERRLFALDDPRRVADALGGMSLVLHCAGPFSRTSAADGRRLPSHADALPRHHRGSGACSRPSRPGTREARAARRDAAARLRLRRGALGLPRRPPEAPGARRPPARPRLPGHGAPLAGDGHDRDRGPRPRRARAPGGRPDARSRRRGRRGRSTSATARARRDDPVGRRLDGLALDRASPTSRSTWRRPWPCACWPSPLATSGRSSARRPSGVSSLPGCGRGRPGPPKRNGGGGARSSGARPRTTEGRRAVSRLTTPEGYTFTARAALAVVESVLAGQAPAGFQTPAKAYGPDFVLGIEGVTRTDL